MMSIYTNRCVGDIRKVFPWTEWHKENVEDVYEKTVNESPNVGLEPTTLRLRVSCSTD